MLSTREGEEEKGRISHLHGLKRISVLQCFFFPSLSWHVECWFTRHNLFPSSCNFIFFFFFPILFLLSKYSKYISLCFYVRCNFSESRNTYRNNSKRLIKRPHTHSYIICCLFEARELMFFALYCSFLIIEIPFPITSTRPYVYSQKQNKHASILY